MWASAWHCFIGIDVSFVCLWGLPQPVKPTAYAFMCSASYTDKAYLGSKVAAWLNMCDSRMCIPVT